ncbi:MAG: AAA family ATPase [Bacteroidetes bacterium]|nr:AAA family ATPase [Bacteroidota bacterium]
MFPENYSISNFKCFKERTSISLRPITINIGPNNSGKSSFIKSLELLKHSLQIHERKESKYILKKDRRAFIPELHSFNLKGMGSPGEFLNSLSNELEIFINPEISEELESYQKYDIKLGLAYVFKENRTRFESDPDSTSFFGGDVMPELPSRGVLNTYTIYIDNKLLVRIEQDEDEEDLSDPENGGEYHGGHSAKITINANLLNILFSSPNTSKLDNGNIVISTTFAWDNFYFISKLLKKVKEVIFGKRILSVKRNYLTLLILFFGVVLILTILLENHQL